MKRILILFTAVTVLISCSRDSDSNEEVTYQNLAGKWNFKSIVKGDGSIAPFVGKCPGKTDYMEIFTYRKIITYNYNYDCVNLENHGCTDFTLTEDDRFNSCSFFFQDATIKNLTATSLKLEFDEPQDLGDIDLPTTNVKAVIFEKQ